MPSNWAEVDDEVLDLWEAQSQAEALENFRALGIDPREIEALPD